MIMNKHQCPRCHKNNSLEFLKYFFITFCNNRNCDFEFKGTIEDFEVAYE